MVLSHETMLHVDIETRSHINLITDGAYKYADPRHTDILIVCYVYGEDDTIGTWLPMHEACPDDFLKYWNDPEIPIGAHNAQFERLLFTHVGAEKYGLPVLPIERFYCTAHQMLVNNIPQSLEDAGRALGTPMQKSKRGKELIKLLAIPRADGTFLEDTELFQEFIEYCKQDVRTERDISQVTRLATLPEMEDYWACEHVNDLGLRVDRGLAEAAVAQADAVADDAEVQIARLTKNEVMKPRGKTLTMWVYDRIPENSEGRNRMTKQEKDKETGEIKSKITLDRNARESLLEWDGLDPHLREVVEVAESVGSGSVAKFRAMMNTIQDDDRVRGSYIAHGAPATGRYSARKIQMHNFSRDTYKDPDPIIKEFVEHGRLPDSPMLAMKRLLRPSLMAADGKKFVCSDLSSIEGRKLLWLTDDPRAEPKLDLYRAGKDVYLATASDIYHETITDKKDSRRQTGKVAELALGFQGGVNSFLAMGANYGVYLAEPEVHRVINEWRGVNPAIVDYWTILERACLHAVDNPGKSYKAGRVTCFFNEQLVGGTLWIKLPSGRLLSYPFCRLEFDEQYNKPFLTSLNSTIKPKAGANEWPRRSLYGGLLAENVTQASSACLLREAIRALVKDGHPVVGHTHDEILLEAPADQAEMYVEILEDYLLYLPPWAAELPLAAESWVGTRYQK